MSLDPFQHVPELRQRIRPVGESSVRVTPDLLAAWDERARKLGRQPGWRLADEARDQSLREMLRRIGAGHDLWVFAYGSLMWDPGLHFAELRRADLPGFRRRFLLRTTLGRGSPEQPGLMLSLERGRGTCRGLALRIAHDRLESELACLWRREMVRGSYRPALHAVATPQGEVTALVFEANTGHPDHVGVLTLQQTARMVARASGFLGSNRDYLDQLAAQLRHLDIDDDYVARLHRQVTASAAG